MRGGTEVEALSSLLMTPRWRGVRWMGTRLLDGVPASVGAARTWVTVRLGVDAPHVPPDTVHTIKLLTSELVTNAITHSRSRDGLLFVRLGVSRPGREPEVHVNPGREAVVHVEVLDVGSDGGHPVLRVDPDGESGRGLLLVEALSLRWGTADAEPGRAVWFQVLASPPPTPLSKRPDLPSGRT
ncbi:ATP-binding protein [Streptosporangium carneum]|uniref:Histidine kinase/HSP90-like ATPase domain-containing protein n=1 Tax=Streptosporangium carneum TaxID=47481 RepID=A0A9W6MGG7_9ACTN|nr:ATP-binding protein [Streptosporangium carneum]GLK13152.1 hypothetical protein GCM10017600_65630 [Streptosporangium carneum]